MMSAIFTWSNLKAGAGGTGLVYITNRILDTTAEQAVIAGFAVTTGVVLIFIRHIYKQILSDPEALLTMKLNSFAEWLKFKKNKR